MSVRYTGYPSHRHIVRIIYLFLLLFLPAVLISTNASYPNAVRNGITQRLEKGVFLVASRRMTDPRFRETVILVTEHGEQGAIGIIVNRPMDIDMAEIFPDMESLKDHAMHPYIGGPIHPTFLSALVNTSHTQKDMSPVIDGVFFGLGTGFVIDLISDMKKDDRLHVYFGYAGWTAGQLEMELHRGDWYIIKADTQAIFDKDPAGLWRDYIKQVSGIWL